MQSILHPTAQNIDYLRLCTTLISVYLQRDVARVALAARSRRDEPKKYWRHITTDEEKLKELQIQSIDEILYTDQILDSWVTQLPSMTLQVLFEKILKQGHILKYVLNAPDKIWLLQVINTFF